MNALTSCPDVQTLRYLQEGRLPLVEVEKLAEHVSTCNHCVEALQSLGLEDTLVEVLRKSDGVSDHGQPPALDALLQRLEQLMPSAAPGTVTDGAAPGAQEDPQTETDIFTLFGPPQSVDELGRLGGYRVRAKLGAGGMGVVFLADDVNLERPIALKVMRPVVAAHANARQRFLREAKAVAALKHPHIVTIYQVGEDGGTPFLAMELLEGESLETRLQREGRLPVAEVLRIGREVASGLAAAHERGLIHRDIKPANIWLEGEPGRVSAGSFHVKLLDFGLARGVAEEQKVTHSDAIVGTPGYMAPEQAQGLPLDARCDLFSLGAVLYRACTGEAPFKGANAFVTLKAVTDAHPPSPRQVNPEMPPALEVLILRLLAKLPSSRPASAGAMIAALEAIQRPEPAAKRRSRWRLVTAAALLLAAGLTAGVLLMKPTGGDGVVVIETDDADVEVVLEKDGKEVVIRDGKRQEVSLPVGQYRVELRRGKERLKLETRQFTLTRGGREIVRVSWLENKGVAPNQPIESGKPLNARVLVTRPPLLPGVRSWTISTVSHLYGIAHLTFSPNGKVLASTDSRTIRLWETGTDKVGLLEMNEGWIYRMSWAPDNRRMAIGTTEGCEVWDVIAGRRLHRIEEVTHTWTKLAWSPDGKRLAISKSGPHATIWDTQTWEQLDKHEFGNYLDYSPDGRFLAGLTPNRHSPVKRSDTQVHPQLSLPTGLQVGAVRCQLSLLSGWESTCPRQLPPWGVGTRS